MNQEWLKDQLYEEKENDRLEREKDLDNPGAGEGL